MTFGQAGASGLQEGGLRTGDQLIKGGEGIIRFAQNPKAAITSQLETAAQGYLLLEQDPLGTLGNVAKNSVQIVSEHPAEFFSQVGVDLFLAAGSQALLEGAGQLGGTLTKQVGLGLTPRLVSLVERVPGIGRPLVAVTGAIVQLLKTPLSLSSVLNVLKQLPAYAARVVAPFQQAGTWLLRQLRRAFAVPAQTKGRFHQAPEGFAEFLETPENLPGSGTPPVEPPQAVAPRRQQPQQQQQQQARHRPNSADRQRINRWRQELDDNQQIVQEMRRRGYTEDQIRDWRRVADERAGDRLRRDTNASDTLPPWLEPWAQDPPILPPER